MKSEAAACRQIGKRRRKQEARGEMITPQPHNDQGPPRLPVSNACGLVEEHHLHELEVIERTDNARGDGNGAEGNQTCLDRRLKNHELGKEAEQRRNARELNMKPAAPG